MSSLRLAVVLTFLVLEILEANAATPAHVFITDHNQVSRIRLSFTKAVTVFKKTVTEDVDVIKGTSNGMYKIDVPSVMNFPGISSYVVLNYIEASDSDSRCHRPTVDINSAYATSATGVKAYCANTIRRRCHGTFIGGTRCHCRVAFSIRVYFSDASGNFMNLNNPGNFHECGSISHLEQKYAQGR